MAWKQIRVGGVRLDLEPPAPDKITFVGARRKEIPDSEFEILSAAYPRIGRALVGKGITAISGGADGMDQLAEKAFGNNVISYRTDRWPNSPRFVRVLDEKVYATALQMVASIHPAWERVKPEHRALHARNMAQVLQDDLRHPTAFLVAWAKPKGVSIDGGTRSAYELSRRVHDGKKTYNLATMDGQRGFADEMRALGIPIERGTWYPRETLSLSDHAKASLQTEGHARIGIAIPIGTDGAVTNAERANLTEKYAGSLAIAKASAEPAVIGDAWNSRIVLIGVPYVQREPAERAKLITDLQQIAGSNVLSRIVLPHEDIEPGHNLYKDVQRVLGAERSLDSSFTFATVPDAHRGISRTHTQQAAVARQPVVDREAMAARR
jgi:hypothetical protein